MVKTMALIEDYKSGDIEARERLILHYMKLAERIAEVYKGLGVDDEDVLQLAYEGLILGIDKCIKRKRQNYNTLIDNYINSSIRRGILSHNFDLDGTSDNLTRNTIKVAILKFRRDFINEYGRDPNFEEICEGTGIVSNILISVLEEMRITKKTSLEEFTFEDSLAVVDGISDPEFELVDAQEPSILNLPPRQKILYTMISNGIVDSKAWIEAMGVTRQAVLALKVKTFKKVYATRDKSGENASLKRSTLEYEKTFVNRRLRDRACNKNR